MIFETNTAPARPEVSRTGRGAWPRVAWALLRRSRGAGVRTCPSVLSAKPACRFPHDERSRYSHSKYSLWWTVQRWFERSADGRKGGKKLLYVSGHSRKSRSTFWMGGSATPRPRRHQVTLITANQCEWVDSSGSGTTGTWLPRATTSIRFLSQEELEHLWSECGLNKQGLFPAPRCPRR